MEADLTSFKEKSRRLKKQNKKFIQSLKQEKPKQLDIAFRELHEEVFSEYSCLDCANCCKSLGPKFLPEDIDRIASYLKMSPRVFMDQYLRTDEDRDLVLQKVPCPFLGEENRCKIYEVRPKACKAYPHTDSRGMHSYLNITFQNTLTCPAVLEIVERMKGD